MRFKLDEWLYYGGLIIAFFPGVAILINLFGAALMFAGSVELE